MTSAINSSSARLRAELASVLIYDARTALVRANNALGKLLVAMGQVHQDTTRERYCQRLLKAVRLVHLALVEVNEDEAEIGGAP